MRHGAGLARVLLLSVTLALAGCGSGGGPLVQSGPITRAHAVAYAQAVELAVADVPSMTSVSLEEEAKPRRSAFEFARCSGSVSPARLVVDIHSPRFRRGSGLAFEEFSSAVEVMPSATIAAGDLGATRGARGRACTLRLSPREVSNGIAGRLAHGRPVVSFLRFPLPHVSGYAFRVATRVNLARASITAPVNIYSEVFEFIAGPAEISLIVDSVSRPASAATERQLLATLYNRATTSTI
jgi:hypothetical protein